MIVRKGKIELNQVNIKMEIKRRVETEHIERREEREERRESEAETLTGWSKQHLDFPLSPVKLDYSNLI